MGAEGAVGIIHRQAIKAAEDPAAERRRLVDDYRERFANPYRAAELGYVDEVIDPADTRRRLIRALALLRSKRDANPAKKHGNIPL
jgi:propionyl-CoA carboxylase beta chain